MFEFKTGKVTEFKENLKLPRMIYVSVCKKADDSEFYKFGGYDCDNNEYVDDFYIGTLPDPKQPIQWKKVEEFKLKQSFGNCGVVIYAHFIIIFGGEIGYDKYLSDIYILDTRSKTGWVRSSIQCPVESDYVAALDDQNNVHIFTFGRQQQQHCRISLRAFIPNLDDLSMTKQLPS